MRTLVAVLLVCSLAIAVTSISSTYRPAHAQSLVLYDAFTGPPLINTTRWVGREEIDATLPPPQGAAEIFRGSGGGQLVLSHRIYSNPALDESEIYHLMALDVRNPATVASTILQATVTIRGYEFQPCPDRFSRVLARVTGTFFNTAVPEPGKFTNDVAARFEVFRDNASTDAPNIFGVRARVRRCIDAACNNAETLATSLGTVKIGQPTTIRMRWDEPSARFLFKRDRNPEVQIVYPWSDDAPPSIPRKALVVMSDLFNRSACTGMASIIAAFDDVFVNP